MATGGIEMKQSKELKTAIAAAKAAGRVIMKHYGRHYKVKLKSARLGIVTEADFAAQKKIKQVILKAFPKAIFLAEEDKKHARLSNESTWVVDPLDGTYNFSRGIKGFSVAIALVKNRQPVLGVISDPSTGDLFSAEKGKGAFLNGKKIRVSGVSQMEKSVYDIPLSVRKGMRKKGLKILNKLMKRLGVLRIVGSAALRFAFIAAGRFDAYIEYGTYPWDVAAGIVILKEAGGKVTDDKGKPLSLLTHDQTLVASNGKIHVQIIKELNK